MTAKTLIILHGWAIDRNNESKWSEFRKLLESRAGSTGIDLKTVFLPLPGLTTKLDKAWTLDDYATWLKEQVDDLKNENEELLLLGHSFGGQLAIRFIAKNPNNISRLILLDSSGIKDWSVRAVLKRSVFGGLASFGKTIFGDNQFMKKVLYKLAREKDYHQADEIQKETMKNVLNDEIVDDLDKVTCSTLIVWGENDQTTPLKNAKFLNEKITSSELSIIDNARHSPQFTHVAETTDVISNFINK
jgi:pimeloyl-ACP methyl ester carboxylesterase